MANISTSTVAYATRQTAGQLVFIASDGAACVLWCDGTNQVLSYDDNTYAAWTKATLTTGLNMCLAGHFRAGTDNIDEVTGGTSNVRGNYRLLTKSGATWTVGTSNALSGTTAIGVTAQGSPTNYIGQDAQGRHWVVVSGATNTLETCYYSAANSPTTTGWTASGAVTQTADLFTPAADQVGNYLIKIYWNGTALQWHRIDNSVASLGSWTTGATIANLTGSPNASHAVNFKAMSATQGLLTYSSGSGVYAQLYTAASDSFGAATQLSTNANDRHPVIAVDGLGNAWVVWCKYAAANSFSLVYKKYSGSWGTETELVASGTNITYPNAGYGANTLGVAYTQGTGSPWTVGWVTTPTLTTSTRTITSSASTSGGSRIITSTASLLATMPPRTITSTADLDSPGSAITYVTDTFTRADQSGFGTASDSVTTYSQLVGNNATLAIVSNEGHISAVPNAFIAWVAAGSQTVADVEITYRVKTNSTNADFGTFFRTDGTAANAYRVRVKGTTGDLAFSRKVANGTWTLVGNVATSIPATANYHWMKTQIIGSTAKAKWWDDGGTEPDWQLTVTDATPISAAGLFGFYTYEGGTATSTWDVDHLTVTNGATGVPSSSRTITTVTGALLLEKSRTSGTTAALLVEKSRTITTVTGTLLVEKSRAITPGSVALLSTKMNTVPGSASLLLEKSRAVASTGDLSLSGLRSVTTSGSLAYLALSRSSGSSAALLAQKMNTAVCLASLLLEKARTSGSTASLLLEKSRTSTVDAALSALGTLTRTIGSSVTLSLEQSRTVPDTASLLATMPVRSIPANVDLDGASTVTTYVTDTFTRADQAGFGTASDGVTTYSQLVGNNATLAIVSNEGHISAVPNAFIGWVAAGALTAADVEITYRVKTNSTNADFGTFFRTDATAANAYRVRVKGTTGDLAFSRKVAAGVWTPVGNVATSIPATANYHWIKTQIIGSTLKAKWWDDGNTEPGWQLTVTDATPISSAGLFGFYIYEAGTATSTWDVDHLTVTNGGVGGGGNRTVPATVPLLLLKSRTAGSTASLSGLGILTCTIPTSGALWATPARNITSTASLGTLGRTISSVTASVFPSEQVVRIGTKLYLRGVQFRFSGVDVTWLGLKETTPVTYPTHGEIDDGLATVVEMGGTAIRSHTLGVSTGNALSLLPFGVTYPTAYTFNDAALEPIDYAIYRAGQLGLKLIIPLTDDYAYYHGGKHDFTDYRGLSETAFYTDANVRTDFKAYISHLLNHVNQYNGIALKNDLTIMAWETGNELSGATSAWTDDIAQYIHSLSSAHLVLNGKTIHSSVSDGTTAMLSLASLDILTSHFYPPSNTNENTWLSYSGPANKPQFIGEYDWTDTGGDSLASFLTLIEGNQLICGDNAWSLFEHKDDYGFSIHGGDSYAIYYPGQTTSARNALIKLRNHAYTMSGLAVPADSTPAAPTNVLLIGGNSLRWRGVVGGNTYDVERSTTSTTGPFSVVATGLTDMNTPWTETNTTPPVRHYRVRAYNIDGVAGAYSSVVSIGLLSRTVGSSAALLMTQSRTIPCSAALLATMPPHTFTTSSAISQTRTRTVTSSAAFSLEQSRALGSSAELSRVGARSIPLTSPLSLTQVRTTGSSVSLLIQKSNTVPGSTALLLEKTRTVTASASLSTPGTNTRTVPASVALSLAVRTIPASVSLRVVSARTITATLALFVQKARTVPQTGAVSWQQSRGIASSSAILATKTRTVTSSVACSLSSLRTLASSAALLSVGSRTIPSSVALVVSRTRNVPATGALSGARAIPVTVALRATSARSMTAVTVLASGFDHTVPCSVALFRASEERPCPARVALSLFIANARVTVPSGYALVKLP